MKNPTIKVDRELFYSKIKNAVKFIPGKVIIPVMDHFMLSVKEGIMEILATDGNIQVKLNCQVKASEDFAFCVPAKYLVKIIGLFRENEVVFTMKKENLLEIKSGKSKYNVTLDAFPNDFPVTLMKNIDSEIAMNQFMLGLGLNQSEKFADDENQNANYTAININEINNKIIFTSLDGYVVARAAIKPISISKWTPISIPTVTAKKVASLLNDNGEIGVTHGDGKIMFFTNKASVDFFEITSVLSDIKFPDSEKLIARRPTNMIGINTLELNDATKRLKLSAMEGVEPIIAISNAANPHEFILTCSDALTGKDGEEIMTVVNPTGLAFAKNFSGNTLTKVLSSIDQSEIDFYFSDQNNVPSFIIPKVTNEEQDIFMFLVSSCIV